MCLVLLGEKNRSAASVVRVSAAAQEEAEENTASSDQEGPQQDVGQSDGPEGEQINSLIAVNVGRVGVVDIDRLIYPVDPHVTSNEPTDDKTGHEGVPSGAAAVQDVCGAFFLLCTGQTGRQGQHQAEHPHHHQEDGDIVLSGTVIQVPCTNSYFRHRQDAENNFAAY